MTLHAKLTSTVIAAGAVLIGAWLPALAASPLTEAFVADVRPNVDLLDRSSRLALDNSSNAGLRRFAHREAVEQTIAANSLVAWAQTNTLDGAEVALGARLRGPAAVAADAVVTGRSVALDAPEGRPLTVTRAPKPSPAGSTAETLTRLSALKGAAFDVSYKETQRESLRQLSAVYDEYARSGDDPALRALATRELPKINRKLAELRKL